ncbi:MAG: hypothetical protein GX025_08720 [Clostridiales bacterium]|nr:hypothetical protein [Clostridiales bacterium]
MKLKRASLVTKIIIIAIVVYAGLNLLSLKVQVSEAQEKRDILKAQAEDVMQTNTELSYAIEHSSDPETIEDIARGKLGLVLPSEKIFYDISG